MVCGDNKTLFRISESSIGRLAVVCELFVNLVRFASNEIRRFFFGPQFRIWWTVVFDVVRFTSFERNCFLRVNSALHTTDSKTKVENRETRRHKREKTVERNNSEKIRLGEKVNASVEEQQLHFLGAFRQKSVVATKKKVSKLKPNHQFFVHFVDVL